MRKLATSATAEPKRFNDNQGYVFTLDAPPPKSMPWATCGRRTSRIPRRRFRPPRVQVELERLQDLCTTGANGSAFDNPLENPTMSAGAKP